MIHITCSHVWKFGIFFVFMDIRPPVINPNDISLFSITLISLEQSLINVSKPQSDCWDLSFGRHNPDDYCAVAQTTSFHSLLPETAACWILSFTQCESLTGLFCPICLPLRSLRPFCSFAVFKKRRHETKMFCSIPITGSSSSLLLPFHSFTTGQSHHCSIFCS